MTLACSLYVLIVVHCGQCVTRNPRLLISFVPSRLAPGIRRVRVAKGDDTLAGNGKPEPISLTLFHANVTSYLSALAFNRFKLTV